jgi:transposase InsO family protein
LAAVWTDWQPSSIIIKPATVIGWHRKGFRLFWAWKIRRGKPGRPAAPADVRSLIRAMSQDNPLRGAPRIHGELLKLGIAVGETSVSKYMVRHRKPPSQTWRTFLENHVKTMVSMDFFTVPTIRFQVLYVFLVLAHDRRRILHFAVTAHPTAEWTAQQLREAFPWDAAPRYLLRDRDRIFGQDFVDQLKAMGIRQVLSAQRSPWQRAYVERVIGTIRRECLDHVIVFGERRTELEPSPAAFRGLLPSEPDAPGIGEGHTETSPRPIGGHGAGYCDAGSRRPASSLRASRRVTTSSVQFHPHGSVLLRGPMDGHRVRAREATRGALSAGDAGRVKSEIALSKHANGRRPRPITPQDWVCENDRQQSASVNPQSAI